MEHRIAREKIRDYNKYIRNHLVLWIVPAFLIILSYFVFDRLWIAFFAAAIIWIVVHVFVIYRKFKRV